MSEFAPPSGPPPPKVPEGWKAVWNDQYSEWFFVNIYTKKSQWEKPDSPVYPPGEAPDLPPPSYAPPASSTPIPPTGDQKTLSSNNPYASTGRASHDISEDERLARQLQEEEDARARASGQGDRRGLADEFYSQQGASPQPGQYGYGQGSAGPYQPSQSPYQDQHTSDKGNSKGGFLGKLLGKASGSRPHHGGAYPPPSGYGQPGYGHYGQPGYGQPGPGYYPQQQMYGPPGRRKPGMGVGGAAALGAGGGLLGGALLGSAMADDGDHYTENNYYGDDGDYGGDGGDFGGGDFGGGDF
ncbi:hypothetical protein CC78DRAFT_533352 [Lojkania enalia]|uniref:WW domain-containing protein n=1 Tax=Lojkania enalia TaxID=147567 RepID=A0A9P4K9H6_9PLEO|nr:hypothetical protein CC78DRAFT_533352 [Didymosphaeria enalia]